MTGNNNMKAYDEFWKSKASTPKWRDFILPNRSDNQFYEEGQYEAEIMNGFYFNEGDIVLEFGCGIGRVIQNIKAKKRIGVDVCQEFLDKIPEPIKKIKTDGTTIKGVKKESVDFIYSLMVFQHINKKDHLKILKQLYSFAKPGGQILIQFPNNHNGYYRQTKFVNVYSKEEIINLMADLGVDSFSLRTGNLVGYKDGLSTPQTPHREYFLLIKKHL